MPEFENLDKYETTDTESGRKRVIPIAPHSSQPSNYRPQRRENFKQKRDNQLPPLKKADFEVVSVEQMEREFKRASRAQGRSRADRPRRNPLKDLRDWFLGLFRKKKKAVTNRSTDRSRSRGGRQRDDKRSESRGPRTSGAASDGNRSERSGNGDGRRPQKRRRPRSQGEGGRSGERDGNREANRDGNREGRSGNPGGNSGGNQDRQDRREEPRSRANSGESASVANGNPPPREGGQGGGSRRRKRNRRPGRSDNGGSESKGPDRDSQ